MASRITYNSTRHCSFEILSGTFNHRYMHDKNISRAGSGKYEAINLYGIGEVNFSAYMSESEYKELVGWWSYARQGQTFSLAVTTADMTNVKLSASATAGSTAITVSTSGNIAAGGVYKIKAIDADNEFEIVTVSSKISTTKYQLTNKLSLSYNTSDKVTQWRYFPSLICLNDAFNPVKEANEANLYRFDFELAESS